MIPWQVREKLHLADRVKRILGLYIESRFDHDVGVYGSYTTGNVGDLAIGRSIKRVLDVEDINAKLYSNRIPRPNLEYTILGGGGVIHDSPPSVLRRRLNFLNENPILLGVGVTQIKEPESEELLSEVLDKSPLITTRDERSKEILQTYTSSDVLATACPALSLSEPDTSEEHRTGVNFRPGFFKNKYRDFYSSRTGEEEFDFEAFEEAYVKNASRIINQVKDPVFIPFTIDDERFAREYLDVDVLEYRFSVAKTLERVSQVEQMVCTRYHSLVFSIICNKPTMALTYAPKVDQLASRAGVPHCLPNSSDLTLDFAKPPDRTAIIEDAVRNFDLLLDELNSI